MNKNYLYLIDQIAAILGYKVCSTHSYLYKEKCDLCCKILERERNTFNEQQEAKRGLIDKFGYLPDLPT